MLGITQAVSQPKILFFLIPQQLFESVLGQFQGLFCYSIACSIVVWKI